MFELACCTEVLLDEINDKYMSQSEVATTYRLAVESSEKTDWAKVNKAIIERWGRTGLNKIKKMARS